MKNFVLGNCQYKIFINVTPTQRQRTEVYWTGNGSMKGEHHQCNNCTGIQAHTLKQWQNGNYLFKLTRLLSFTFSSHALCISWHLCGPLTLYMQIFMFVLQYRISGIFPQLLTFALEKFGKGNFRKQVVCVKISYNRIFIVNEIIHLTKNINTSCSCKCWFGVVSPTCHVCTLVYTLKPFLYNPWP